MKNLSPDWPEEKIDLSELCFGDIHRPLQLSIYDYERDGNHVIMGGVEITIATLVEKFKNNDFR